MARPARHSNMVLATDAPPLDTSKLRYDYSAIAAQYRQRVMEAAVDILAHGRRAKESIIAMGERLIEVKALLPDGTFTAWLHTEFELSPRMAENFMNVAKQYGDRPEIISVLNDTVLYLLAAPSTPEAAREQVEALAVAKGKSPRVATTQAIIKAHRTPQPPAPPPPTTVVYVESTQSQPTAPEQLEEDEPKIAYAAFDSASISPEWIVERLVKSRTYDNALRNAGEKECMAALAQIPESEETVERRTRIEARLGQVCEAAELTAALPSRLLQAGYSLEQLENDLWRWRHKWPKGYYHVGHAKDTPVLAIEDAFTNYAWHEKAGNIGKDSPRIEVPTDKPPDPRVAQAKALRQLLRDARDKTRREYGALTGKHTQLPPFERAVEALLEPLDSLLAILEKG